MSLTLVTKDVLTGGPYIIVCDSALSNWPPSDKLAPLQSGKRFYCVGSLEDQYGSLPCQISNGSGIIYRYGKKFFEPGHEDLCNLHMIYLVWVRGMCKQLLSMYGIPVTWVDRTRPTLKTHRVLRSPLSRRPNYIMKLLLLLSFLHLCLMCQCQKTACGSYPTPE